MPTRTLSFRLTHFLSLSLSLSLSVFCLFLFSLSCIFLLFISIHLFVWFGFNLRIFEPWSILSFSFYKFLSFSIFTHAILVPICVFFPSLPRLLCHFSTLLFTHSPTQFACLGTTATVPLHVSAFYFSIGSFSVSRTPSASDHFRSLPIASDRFRSICCSLVCTVGFLASTTSSKSWRRSKAVAAFVAITVAAAVTSSLLSHSSQS